MPHNEIPRQPAPSDSGTPLTPPGAPCSGQAPVLCPTCGRPAFCLVASVALDALLIAKEALEDAQAVLEMEVLP